MRIEVRNGIPISIIEKDSTKINSVSKMIDLMADARFNGCYGLVVFKEVLGEDFFDLKTGNAGEILQKFSTYDMKIGIVGDFSIYKSKSLKDFIFESNKGKRVFFMVTVDKCLDNICKT